ncbi:MAG: hypothetical protein L6R42_001468 [Xanthoria sp. 1 TBL-2021]|nr:MAG: hypothetical protein L6R42_001468 [Xanthoria sp. 1 TBL-2021]
MDTDVAYRHQTHPHLRSPSSVNAYTAPKAPVADHPRHGCLTSIPLNSPGTQQPIHYTQPTQSIKGPFQPSSYPHDSRSYVAGHEHMLRRKTPNGTLAAGYDGRPVEWATRRPANKYFLMPASNTTGDAICQPYARHKEYDKQVVQRAPSSENHWRHNTESDAKPYLAPGLDSVLYQGSPSYLPGPHAGGQQIPMVMQPMWPPCVGITSLNHPGPYGPYWPNGAFVPYRPAPIRDPRFHTGLDEHVLLNRTPDQIYLSSMPHNVPPHPPSRPRLSPRSQGSAFSHHISAFGTEKLTESGETPLWTYRPNMPSLKSPGHHSMFNSDAESLLAIPENVSAVAPLSNQKDPVVTNVRYNEQILIWAHRVYVNLLSFRQQSRRTGSNVQRPIHRYPPEQVLPQLPQGTSFRSRNTHNNHTARHSHYSADPYENDPASYPDVNGNSSLFSSHALGSESNFAGPCKSSSISSKHGSLLPLQTDHDASPTAAAVCAIEILSKLGQESGWRWTDGMLLGGCLAYGLGEYTKAFKWYSKVLQCDPNNVEAISNLAATLLSLDRRQEAEEYWLRSVKLRPSYFEAVEHLVGMYCEDHRGREAVKLIEFVEQSLQEAFPQHLSEPASEKSASPNIPNTELSDSTRRREEQLHKHRPISSPNFGSSGYSIPSLDNGRMLSLIHGKGNMLYALGDNAGAAKAFEKAILIGSGQRHHGIRSLIGKVLSVFTKGTGSDRSWSNNAADEPILLMPQDALETSRLVFLPYGNLPGLEDVPTNMARRAGISIVSNSLLSLAKIYQDGMSSSGATATGPRATSGVKEILALYYLSLSLQPSPSTANNVGILLASVQQPALSKAFPKPVQGLTPGVVPGSGIHLALAYYQYGLNLDSRHAHLYTNLGSLFKDIGQLSAAIKMYEKAVQCDGNFDIALANLANAVKDQGRISDAIDYYRRAVTANPDFAEAVCGLANALNSVCNWHGRGGVTGLSSRRDRWHVDEKGMLYDGYATSLPAGWIERVVAIVDKQLSQGEGWGRGLLQSIEPERFLRELRLLPSLDLTSAIQDWAGKSWEGARVVRLIERATKRLGWQYYRNRYVEGRSNHVFDRTRPQLPAALAVPTAPTVLPFHTFTCPLSAKQIRKISQRNGLRISCSTLRAAWLPRQIYEPPPPPGPHLNVGYLSSDFNNHPLAHLMQSVFGFHDGRRVKATCYATTASDGSVHRQKIEREAPIFHDASSWPIDRLVNQIVADKVHILINLNGYTRGAKNEVFAARPAPVQMSFMGFAGTLGAEWCDYLLADKIAIPPQTLRPSRQNVDLVDQITDGNNDDDQNQWIYGENVIFARETFFCCDHRQSAPDAHKPELSWAEEQQRRWRMRKELFPSLPHDTVILGNFNQLYKIEPTTFRTWLRILARTPKAVLWLLRFPELGETNLRETAMSWVGAEVASRVIFTDVAPKHQHISRARICDVFLDTPECNAHTTAADVLWSGTPLLTFPRYEYKMCSRMAASILSGALPKGPEGDAARRDLIVHSDEEYEDRAVELATDLVYLSDNGKGWGRLMELRKLLFESRWTSALFDTRRWVRDLEEAYELAWKRWVEGEGGDIWL